MRCAAHAMVAFAPRLSRATRCRASCCRSWPSRTRGWARRGWARRLRARRRQLPRTPPPPAAARTGLGRLRDREAQRALHAGRQARQLSRHGVGQHRGVEAGAHRATLHHQRRHEETHGHRRVAGCVAGHEGRRLEHAVHAVRAGRCIGQRRVRRKGCLMVRCGRTGQHVHRRHDGQDAFAADERGVRSRVLEDVTR